MLDENLPTFFFRQSSDKPLTTILYFTQNGTEPAAEYQLQKLDPTLPQARNKYAIALGDATAQGVFFGEVVIEPEFQQPTLSAAEIRAQNSAPPAAVPIIPDGFTIQLLNPDQFIAVRGEKSTWTGKESFEFEMPQQSFRMPSASTLDRQQSDPTASSLTPKITFRWKRDSKFSKDMTCYLTGRSVGGKRSKDPDITIALYKHTREPCVTIYEPNLQRVDVEDRKGLEVVLLLGAEVIREIYLFPSRDSFNVSGAPPNRRRNSRPMANSAGSPKPADPYAMSSAVGNGPPGQTQSPVTQQPTTPQDARARAEVEAETQRLLKQQERELAEEKRRRQREVDAETERLKQQFGLEGQDFAPKPPLPTRNTGAGAHAASGHPPLQLVTPVQPPRPSSVGPRPQPQQASGSWISGPSGSHVSGPFPQPSPQPNPGGRLGRMKKKSTFF
ncbi:hypothetical protein GGR56DRAFT_292287 [Xylariaceae sp. FL0804]|nr:hypothetical protein GGR56DRAFT_292287 [Xylariaceae sp. FL0804]